MNSTTKQSQFFSVLPGIYYHVTCRSSCDGLPETLMLRRSHSINYKNKHITDVVFELIEADPTYQSLLSMLDTRTLSANDKSIIRDVLVADIEKNNRINTPIVEQIADLLESVGGTKRRKLNRRHTRVNFVVKRRLKTRKHKIKRKLTPFTRRR